MSKPVARHASGRPKLNLKGLKNLTDNVQSVVDHNQVLIAQQQSTREFLIAQQQQQHQQHQQRSKKRGWQGEEMELEHAREAMREGKKIRQPVAVDLEQFRNREVGKGYQAKHVVRQRTAEKKSSITKIKDMTKAAKVDDGSFKKQSSKSGTKHKNKRAAPESKETRVSKYMQCEAFRRFRKEIEAIVSSSSS